MLLGQSTRGNCVASILQAATKRRCVSFMRSAYDGKHTSPPSKRRAKLSEKEKKRKKGGARERLSRRRAVTAKLRVLGFQRAGQLCRGGVVGHPSQGASRGAKGSNWKTSMTVAVRAHLHCGDPNEARTRRLSNGKSRRISDQLSGISKAFEQVRNRQFSDGEGSFALECNDKLRVAFQGIAPERAWT